jgi:hypothetical protein
MYKADRRRAVRQGAVCIVLLTGAIAASVAVHRRPAGPDELKIQIALLRSQAGEFALVAREGPQLPARFIAAQSRQMRQKLTKARADLDGLQLQESELRAMRRDVQEKARGLTSDPDAAALLERQRALQRAESRLERGQGG